MRELSFGDALNRAAAYCSGTERCRSEVVEKLRRWGVEEADIEKIVTRLTVERFLDERRYAEAYVRDKFRYNGWGRRKISLMLRAKEIDGEVAEEAMQAIGDEEYEEALARLLAAKAKGMKFRDSYDRNAKLMRFAAGRGFESSVIYDVLKRI